jgi:predicted nucleic-acid-binding Zn-ribbon protein
MGTEPDYPADGTRGCPKCGHTKTEVDNIRTSGNGLSRLFDVQNRKFRVVSYTNCGYAELYKGSGGGNLTDLFLG